MPTTRASAATADLDERLVEEGAFGNRGHLDWSAGPSTGARLAMAIEQ
ncbi:MAG TPA: hypothetical protein VMT15_18620 [Bryobacteraceae bacterium]|nr:hypothetical protein [Bryobacteraceae bacterium]